jgi:hypothetical protein
MRSDVAEERDDWRTPARLAEQCEDLYGFTAAPRWGPLRDLSLQTYGPVVAKIMAGWGEPPMPHQRYILDTALEVIVDSHGEKRFKYSRVLLSIMRQQGKTTIAYALVAWRAMAFINQLIYYAAQDRNYGRQRLEEELWPRISRGKFNGKKLKSMWMSRFANGNERLIYEPKQSRIRIIAPTASGGHGPPLDFCFLDEIFKHQNMDVLQAVSPAMLTRGQWGQLWMGSNAGDEKSVLLNKERSAGRLVTESFYRHGAPYRYAYYEWSFPDGEDHSDPDLWVRHMPGLCPNPPCHCDPRGIWHHTCTAETIRAELDAMREDPGAFLRAYGNRTAEIRPLADPNIPRKAWRDSVDETSCIGKDADIVLAAEVSPGRDRASISVAGLRDDGLVHVECIANRAGVDWLPSALARLVAVNNPLAVVVDAKGPAGPMIGQMEQRGLRRSRDLDRPRRGNLAVVDLAFVLGANSRGVDEIRAGRIRHRDQPMLTAALNSAMTRPIGDGWVVSRRMSGLDVSPFVAALLARHGLEVIGPKVRAKVYDVAGSIA